MILDHNGQNSAATAPASATQFVFPTTFAQQRLWFLEQLQPGGTSYLIPWYLRIEGTLNVPMLEKSLNEIVQRHEILRTTFRWEGDIAVQVVEPHCFSLPVLNLSGLDRPEERAEELARAEARIPLDLERGPLFRAQLLRVSPQLHVLLLTMHHIMFDGWSRRILIQELSTLYEAFCAGRPSTLPAPDLQYADYAVWQRKRLQGATLERQLSYWRNELAAVPASLDLPFDRPRPAVQTFNGARLPVALSKDLTDKLAAYSREHSGTLFMTLLAGFQVLLSRYTNQDDLCIGTPIANRNRAELENIIGLFANTLILRTKFSADSSFQDVLAQVRETSLGAYAHQDVPFEKLVEELRPDRNLSQNPLFQVLFSLQNAPRQAFELSGLSLKLMDLGQTTSKFDISVFLSETPEGVRGRFEFNTDLFDQATIERMIRHYEILLANAVANPSVPVAQISMLMPEEEHQLLHGWNATRAEYPRNACLHELFEAQVKRTPDAIAVLIGKEQVTYRALDQRANRLANHLQQFGVGPETLVGIFLDRSIDMVVALLAVLKAGGAYIPLDPAYPAERIAFILDDADAKALITQKDLLNILPAGKASVIVIDAEQSNIARGSANPPAPRIAPENLAYVLYTSGSTGKPKGVQITHANLVNLLTSMQAEPGLTAHDVLLAVTTLSFDIAGLEIYLPLISGAKIVLASRTEAADGARLLSLIRTRKPTIMQATPATWRMLIEAGWQGSPDLKVLCGGEALPGNLAAQLIPRCSELWNMYGPTETTIWSSMYRVQSPSATAPIGRPIANTTFYILDANLHPVPVGVAGELYIGGESVARGYFRRPELTESKFIRDPFDERPGARIYRTGDLARYLPDSNVQYLGRTDFQVKVRGFRIELGEIESVLARNAAVHQAVVAAREDSPGDRRLVAYIVPAPGKQISIVEMRAYLKQALPDYMLPSGLVTLESLPLTPNGKVDRKALPKPDSSKALSALTTPPRDDVESMLAGIWQEILGVRQINVTDNFFDLGGHSLMAVRLINEIKKLAGVEIPLTALFQDATIERLANLVRGTANVSQAVVHQIQAGGDRPPFFAAVLAGLNSLGYVPLAKHLGPEQPFYTLQTPGPGPNSTGKPYTSHEYEAVAAEYVRAMRTIQPHGPYYIGGTCEGARIACEMTRLLESQGETVDLLAIIDTWVVENTQNRSLWKLYYYYDKMRRLSRQPWSSRMAAVQKAVRNRLKWWTGSKSAPRKSEWIQTYWPGESFVPAQVHSTITVFKIPKQPFYYRPDPLLGWGSRTTSGVTTELVPHGKHLLLLREPYVRELAAALSKTLRRLRPEFPKISHTTNESESADVTAVSH
jgi:amino acid adenylation domain-containing protein